MAFRVALTIDVEHPDRPSRPRVTEDLLDVFAARDVRATMFIEGRWAQAYPALARQIAAGGHLIGCHSHFHARMPMLTRRGLASDVRLATAAIGDITGADARPWFRSPFGALDGGTAVLDQLRTLGYQNVGWNVDSHDWATRGSGGVAVARRVVEGAMRVGDGSIVLMHGWPPPNPKALPRVIDELRDRGATFVTIDALDALPSRAAWDTRAE
jgi:peptidoglycan/xylan/chitin deacetylase (PgdA/CDA1 family)